MEKLRRSADPVAAMHWARPHGQAKPRVTQRALLQENCQTKAMLLVHQPAKPALLELQPHLKDLRLRQRTETLLEPARAPQCLRGPAPFAFFQETPDVEKCNRAVRYADFPISARYRWRCNRREFVGYGNRRSRSLHKRARPAGTFPIAVADKCPSPLRRIQD